MFGIAHNVVNPPAAPAIVPVATVSLNSCPGSLKWQWRSINPGTTILLAASMISKLSLGGILFDMSEIILF